MIGKVEERLRHLAWLPVLLLLAAIIVLRAMNLRDSYGSSHLLLSLNVVFFTLTSLGIVFLMGRSFLILGRPGLLLLGCGVLIWGVAGPVAVAADPDNVNIQITIHNICVWLAALCHLAGVVFSLRSHRTLGATGWWLGVSYLLTLVAVGVVMLVTLTGWLPTFFVQGQGGTLVRYVVLGSAIAIFGQSAVLLRFTNRPSPFADWYALSLWLIAVGLFGIMLQSSAGSVLGWVGRAAQYLGGVCMFIAALAVLRTSGIPVISLATRIHEIRYAYIIAIIIVLVATVVRLVFLSVLGTAVPFVLFFPAVVLAALYGGLRAGVLATLLSVIVTDFFWMNPPMTFADWLANGLFVLSGLLISWVTEAMHHAQARAHDAEAQASIAATRLQDQQALRESRNDMDRAQEVGQLGSWRLDVRRNVLTWSAENHRIFGIPQGTPLTYETFLATIHPDDRQYVDTQWQAGLRGEPYDIEHRIVVDGQVNWVREKAYLEFDDAGMLSGGFGITQDITVRKQAEADRERLLDEIERWAAELDATLGSIADGLIIYDARGNVTRINETAKVITGHPDGETPITLAEQVAIVRLECPDGTPFPLERLPATRALRGEMVTGEIIVTRHPDRAYWLSVSAAPIHDNDGALMGAVLTFTDITALHELQEQQRILLHLVSHDLRTPLAVVSGHAELVQERVNRLGIDGDVGFSLQAIRRGIRRMNVMVEDLTDMARAEGGQLQLKCQSVALRPFVTELLERSQTALDTARVRLEVDETLPPVLADPDRLDRIITNLLSNALKYGEADSPVTIAARQEDGTVAIAITDQGFGIAPGELSRLFQRFYRAPGGRKAEGIGLGLYITRLLVEAHGGAIRVESTPGQGSTFTVTLPVAGSRE